MKYFIIGILFFFTTNIYSQVNMGTIRAWYKQYHEIFQVVNYYDVVGNSVPYFVIDEDVYTITIDPDGGLIIGQLKFPLVDGTNGQSLITNGTGTLSWSTITGGVLDTVHYIDYLKVLGLPDTTGITDDFQLTYDKINGNLYWKIDAGASAGISNLVEDTTPQLGGHLDIQGFNIEGVSATEFSYVDGVTSDIQTQLNNKQTSGTYLIPSDSISFRAYSAALYQPIGTYLIPSDSVSMRAYSNALYATAGHNHSGIYEALDATIIKQADVDDTPVDAATTVPVSSNWAYDHINDASVHQIGDVALLQDSLTDKMNRAEISIYETWCWGIIDTVITGDLPGWKVPFAMTIVEVSAYTDANTTTFNLDERVETTPNVAGIDVMAADLVADSDQQEQTSFSNANLDEGDWLIPTISATGDVEIFSITVKFIKQ